MSIEKPVDEMDLEECILYVCAYAEEHPDSPEVRQATVSLERQHAQRVQVVRDLYLSGRRGGDGDKDRVMRAMLSRRKEVL